MICHYLLTMDLGPVHLHAYAMGPKREGVDHVIDQMLRIASEHGAAGPLTHMVLMTELGPSVTQVREIVGKHSEEARKLFEAATKYHLSIWMMQKGDPEDDTLMELH